MNTVISKATLGLVLVLTASWLLSACCAGPPPTVRQAQALWGGDRVRLMM
jgi:hypothetical protein